MFTSIIQTAVRDALVRGLVVTVPGSSEKYVFMKRYEISTRAVNSTHTQTRHEYVLYGLSDGVRRLVHASQDVFIRTGECVDPIAFELALGEALPRAERTLKELKARPSLDA